MSSTGSEIDVRKVAALARLELTDDEVALFSTQLTSILEYVNRLREVDTRDVPPTSHPLADGPHWREDDPRPSLDRDTLLAQAPGASVTAGLFKVPKVL